jgi:hypothetical protein
MSNKFIFIFLILIPICGSWHQLWAYSPQDSDFYNRYQHNIYRSYLHYNNFSARQPASMAKDKISRTYQIDGQNIEVEYILKEQKIYRQREKLAYIFEGSSTEYLRVVEFIEEFVYKLHTADARFIQDLLDIKEIALSYDGYHQTKAYRNLIQEVEQKRLKISPLQIFRSEGRLIAKATINEGKLIQWEFSGDFEILQKNIDNLENRLSLMLPTNSSLKTERNIFAGLPQVRSSSKKTLPQIPKESDRKIDQIIASGESWTKSDQPHLIHIEAKPDSSRSNPMSLASLKKISAENEFLAFIDEHIHKVYSREILNNKISDPVKFLETEFPYSRLEYSDDKIFLYKNLDEWDFSGDLKLKVIKEIDGINITAIDEFAVQDNKIILSETEIIDVSDLNLKEQQIISLRLPQLVYGHRSLGSRLLNFLLIKDDVPSTLVIQTDKRTIFELTSYAELLLILNDYWQDRQIFFRIEDIKKVSGNIEIRALLIAHDHIFQKNDTADVRFLLNKNYNMDMIMMFFFPDTRL